MAPRRSSGVPVQVLGHPENGVRAGLGSVLWDFLTQRLSPKLSFLRSIEIGNCIAVQVCMLQIPILVLFTIFYVSSPRTALGELLRRAGDSVGDGRDTALASASPVLSAGEVGSEISWCCPRSGDAEGV